MTILEFYKNNINNSDIYNKASQYLLNDTLIKKLYGIKKIKELDGMDQESLMINEFYPSCFYTFLYNLPDKQVIKKISFVDYIPLIMCFGIGPKFIHGINFNLIPNKYRAAILNIIQNSNPTFYNNDIAYYVENNQVALNQQFASILINDKSRLEFIDLISNKLKIDLKIAYRKYNRQYIKNARLIEYSSWKYIPFFDSDYSVRDVNLKQLQNKIKK